MSDLITEIQYPLLVPFEYASTEGEAPMAKHILLIAPSSRFLRDCAHLKQAFFRAMPKGDEIPEAPTAEKKESAKIKGEDILMVMAASDVDLGEVYDTIRNLFVKGCAKIDSDIPMNVELMKKVSMEDMEGMAGAFLENFILRSALARMNQS